ncbi:hypothetical protein SprV_0301371100 [Sparganum proliferum]
MNSCLSPVTEFAGHYNHSVTIFSGLSLDKRTPSTSRAVSLVSAVANDNFLNNLNSLCSILSPLLNVLRTMPQAVDVMLTSLIPYMLMFLDVNNSFDFASRRLRSGREAL